MSKNMFDGLFLVTNDIKILEQNQHLILQKLDRMERKVYYNNVFNSGRASVNYLCSLFLI